MKWSTIALASIPLAWAAPSRPFLQMQNDGSHLLTIAEEKISTHIPAAAKLKDLTADDFISVQQSIKHSLAEAEEALVKTVSDVAGKVNEVIDSGPQGGPPPPHHRPPPHHVLDFSNYTILEILNASLHRPPPHHPDSSESGVDDLDRPHWKFPFPGHHGPPSPSHLPLHRLAWLVNTSAEAQANLAKAENVTLLAPTDWALTPPHRRSHKLHKKFNFEHAERELADDDEDAQHFVDMMDSIEAERTEQPAHHPFYMKELHKLRKGATVDVAEDRKALFSKIIGWVLEYHTLPTVSCAWGLAQHSTVATSLAPGGEPLRISIEPIWKLLPFPHPTIGFNYYAQKRGPTIKAKNGLIHLVSAPLLPPLTPLNKVFLFPGIFSIFTNAIQKVDLDAKILPPPPKIEDEGLFADEKAFDALQDVANELTKEVDGQWTLFAPTNWAFQKLGPKILALLHSPFPISRRILKYILSYHLVPDIAFYSDYINNQSSLAPYYSHTEIDREVPLNWLEDSHESLEGAERVEGGGLWEVPKWPKRPPFPGRPKEPAHPPPPHHPPPHHHKANVTHYHLPTLLLTSGVNPNATMHVLVVEFRLFGKGPLRRSVIVLPHLPKRPHGEAVDEEQDALESEMEIMMAEEEKGEKKEKKKKVCPGKKGRRGPKPVKVWKKDGVARNGAIHVLNDLLRPPFYHHNSSSVESNEHGAKRSHHGSHNEMEWAMKQLFD